MTSVQFDTPGASMRRTANLPSEAGSTIAGCFKITSYEDWVEPFVVAGGSGTTDFWGVEADSGGNIYMHAVGSSDYLSRTISTGSSTAWFYIAASFSSGVLSGYYHQAGGSWTALSTITITGSITETEVGFGAVNTFAGSINGTFRSKHLRIWSSALTSVQLQAERDSTTPVITSGLLFSNDGTTASNVNVDQSATASDFTLTGTPTDEADDPPFATGGGGDGGGATPQTGLGFIGGMGGGFRAPRPPGRRETVSRRAYSFGVDGNGQFCRAKSGLYLPKRLAA